MTQQIVQTTPAATLSISNVTQTVLRQIQAAQSEKRLVLPPNYSAETALAHAAFILKEAKDKDGKPISESCTNESIISTLYKMIVFGLNPSKRQCSFVPYGNQLTLVVEYQGKIAIAKRHGVTNVVAHVIYKGEEFSYEKNENGINIISHKSTIEALDGEIIGAYCVVYTNFINTPAYIELMTFKQIQAAWNQGAMKGNSPAHKNFADQMAKKTVINRALKTYINSSDDADLYEQTAFEDAVIADDPKPQITPVELPPNDKRTEAGF